MSTANRTLLQNQILGMQMRGKNDPKSMARMATVQAELDEEPEDAPVDHAPAIAQLEAQMAAIPLKSKSRSAAGLAKQIAGVQKRLDEIKPPATPTPTA